MKVLTVLCLLAVLCCTPAIKEVVNWVENMWTEEGFMTGFGEFYFTPDQYEIIGNIYENPELLEEKCVQQG